MPGDFIVAIVVAAGIPSAITGFCFWCVQQKIAKRDKEQEEMEKAKEENEPKKSRDVSLRSSGAC